MVRKSSGILIFIAFRFISLLAQPGQDPNFNKAMELIEERGEVDIEFIIPSGLHINNFTKILSICTVEDELVTANANLEEFYHFISYEIPYSVITPPSEKDFPAGMSKGSVSDWSSYPSYEQYDSVMHKFAEDYPALCRLDTIGLSVEGRQLLVVKISDNVMLDETEPEFMYSSTMHGNETGGYILMLRLIDHLLTYYNIDSLVTRLVNETEIWINPLANPDGTYAGGNHTVVGSTRRNANSVDLNRNFPDPADGPHPDGNDYQPETQAMMDFIQERRFILSANFHSGAEVVNYPWDTWSTRHADDNWFQFISHEYADTVQQYSSSYMTGFNDGITNGYDWYSIAGGRQDYVTYFHGGREVTIELDNDFITPEEQLADLWEYNYRSLLNYMEQSLFGIHGTVTDSVTGAPLKARIVVPDHDADSSHVFSDSLSGEYHRLIFEGTYRLQVSAPGYHTKVLEGILVENRMATTTPIQLVSIYEKNFLSFSIPGQTVPSVIDTIEHTVSVTVPEGTGLTGLTASFTLSPGASATILSIPQVSGISTNDFTNPITYKITGGDGTTQDWVVTVTATGIVIISDFPYSEDFESSADYWKTNGTNSSWQYGIPAGATINTAASGSNAWMTNLSGDYNANETSYVYSPVFDLSGLDYPAVEIKVWWDSEDLFDGTCLQYSDDSSKTWHTLMKSTDYLWYNRSDIATLLNITGSGKGWSGDDAFGTGSDEWVTVRAPITGPDNFSFVRFRFTFASNDDYQNDGFAFDDFKIYSDPVAGTDFFEAGIEEILVYPNPGKGIFTLTGALGYRTDLVVEVLNLNGRIIMTREFPGTEYLNERIDLSSCPKGIYFLRIKAGTHLKYQKIIIQ
ncbi:MAG: T9SS type A sorting domain-containing protein [Bacteroidales bacterium]|nr:MAG: T9SS type A sorting domain-containing protein [Bacteroidales bacterium]